ncbi:MAG TPA: hypothetical protein VG848_01380 [Acetobacteraceae bacterium]|nr:hypothetical protein [Acetobacteraceae bacterium]
MTGLLKRQADAAIIGGGQPWHYRRVAGKNAQNTPLVENGLERKENDCGRNGPGSAGPPQELIKQIRVKRRGGDDSGAQPGFWSCQDFVL